MNQPLEPVVAVIDDDASLRRSLINLLGSVGLATEAYASAEEFLSRAQPSRLACLVLDLRLSDMSGLELTHELRERQSSVPIVILSAQGDTPTRQRCLDAGADVFLTKPFLPDELVRTVRDVLRRP